MLQITQRRQEGTLIAVYTGELDHHAARAAIEQTEDLLVLFPCEKLVLDLSELTFMDSSGIGLILGRVRLLQFWKGHVVLCGLSPNLGKMVELSGIASLAAIERRAG